MKTFISGAICVLLVLHAALVGAEEKLPEAEQKEAFRAAFAKARKGKVDEAVDGWEALLPKANGKVLRETHFNLAAAYNMQKKLPAAWYHIDAYLKLAEKADKTAEKERSRLAKVLAKKGYAPVKMICSKDGATLRFVADRERAIPCPATWWFARGVYNIGASLTGHRPTSSDIEVAGAPMEIRLQLEKEVGKGTLVVAGDGKAVQVFLNGALEGSVPFHRQLPEGSYELMVGKPGEMPWKKQITIEAGKTITERPEVAQRKPTPPPVVEKVEPDQPAVGTGSIDRPTQLAAKAKRDLHLLEWSLVGTGAALAVGGAVLHGMAAVRNSELESDYPADGSLAPQVYVANRDAYNEAYDNDVQPKLWAAYGLYAVGAVAVGTGVTLLLVNRSDRKQSKEKAFSLAPVVLPDGGAVTFGMAW